MIMEKIFNIDILDREKIQTSILVYISDLDKIKKEALGYLRHEKKQVSIGQIIDLCVQRWKNNYENIKVEEIKERTRQIRIDIDEETNDFLNEKKEMYLCNADFFHVILKHTKYAK